MKKKIISGVIAVSIGFSLMMPSGHTMDNEKHQYLFSKLFSQFSILNFEENTFEFHEYSQEYFIFADTPQIIYQDIIQPENPRILEIGSGKGYFIDKVLEEALSIRKKIGFAAVEFNEENREEIKKVFKGYEKSSIKHNCILSHNPNVIDYIRRNPEKKDNFFTSIVSLYSLHCLSPSDLIEVILASHKFLQSGGTLWLTLQHAAAVNQGYQKILTERYRNGDMFPGYNLDEERAKKRIRVFLNQPSVYPINAPSGNKRLYADSYLFAHDFSSLLPTMHDKEWTKNFLIDCGFRVKQCKVITDCYPARHLQPGEISNDSIETEYLFVKASKNNGIPNLDRINLYKKSASEKERIIFSLYKEIIEQGL